MAIEVFNRYEHKYMLDRETFETEITQQHTIIGTQMNGGMGFDRGPRMQ